MTNNLPILFKKLQSLLACEDSEMCGRLKISLDTYRAAKDGRMMPAQARKHYERKCTAIIKRLEVAV